MRKYYAYKPDKDGKEPMGTMTKMLFELKTDAGAIHRAFRQYGTTARVYQYTNFYDNSTFRCVIGPLQE